MYKKGEYQGPCVPEIKELLSKNQKIFLQDQDIPSDRKLIVTEDVMDNWIAAHYGIPNLEMIPHTKPHKMPRVIYERLKKHLVSKKPQKVSVDVS